MFLFRKSAEMPTRRDRAARARETPIPTAERHFVNGRPLQGPYPEGMEKAVFGLGCFWGAERKFWQLGDGVCVTAVGYAGGIDAEPDLRGGLLRPHRPQRGRARGLRPEAHLLRGAAQDLLGEPRPDAGHAPGQRRRHAVPLRHLRLRRGAAPGRGGLEGGLRPGACRRAATAPVTTEIAEAGPFYFAEDYHQQYLAKNPRGYCGLGGTGVACQIGTSVAA